ncbi:hypothetical protein AWJ20_2436 [Sugiyamaella lignohabitans]|uniref:Luciferase-like domain-containing protein n=1 Tax=Sugiyamaella lignohabitans TaxID=796027 RepID=A0A167F4R8_9ASCO|nr:uncharacterized protein AWJ20_2436 [Sugiyamaella lignohabitans]ANB14824.1 hypothetical protein AWJ20_2436 [Sugiyamaella lignohabitans]
MTAPQKQWILNAFAMHTPGHLNPGAWKSPVDQGYRYKDIKFWVDLAKKLEDAKFHAIFFADVLGGYDVYGGPKNLVPTLKAAAQLPVNDPLYAVSAMAAATENIAFGVTASTTYDKPYLHARRFSTVDHLSGGRVGWNIVTSYLDSAARNLDLETQIPHDERYLIADEFLEVSYKLWNGSWRDDAVVKTNGIFTDPDGVREINHKGKYFNVPGPHISEPSLQRTPLLFQAGTSTAGKKFAAKHAEVVFVGGLDPVLVRKSVDDLRKQVAEYGRDPRSIKIIASFSVIIGATDEEAEQKEKELLKYADLDGALALFGGWTGYDLATYADDEDFRFVKEAAIQSFVTHWSKYVPGSEGKVWNKRTIAERISIGGLGGAAIGGPEKVADELARWAEIADLDGFNLSYTTVPGSFDDIIKYLLPELRKRGLFWDDYAVPGGTARENFYGIKGQSYLPDDHPGSKYLWKAGEEQPDLNSADNISK